MVPVTRGGVELVALRDLLPGLGAIAVKEDLRARSSRSVLDRREVSPLRQEEPGLGGSAISACLLVVRPPRGRTLARSLDSLSRVLDPLLRKRVDFRAASRVLLVGNVDDRPRRT